MRQSVLSHPGVHTELLAGDILDGMDQKPRFRFSLRALAGFVALVAVYCAALVNASELMSGVALLFAVLLLSLAVVAAIESQGSRRAYWRGFAISGFLYMVLSFGPVPDRAQLLAAENVLFRVAEVLPGATPTWEFVRVGQAGVILLFALAGGLVGKWAHAGQATDF